MTPSIPAGPSRRGARRPPPGPMAAPPDRPRAGRCPPRSAVLGLLLLAAVGCAGTSRFRLEPPAGDAALGLTFGAPREASEAALRAAGIPFAPARDDPETLIAARCPRAPAGIPCRLSFGPTGLYAAQLEAAPEDAARLVAAAESGLGRPTRREAAAADAADGATSLLAAWERDGWTIGVTRARARDASPGAVLRVERDAVAPPVVAGVPLGRTRAEVEALLARQGAVLVQRDAEATTWLGCPLGDAGALTCVVSWVGGRAASVTEVHPTPARDRDALAAWRALAERFAGEIGRPPVTSECPADGPERATGDCTATWGSERLAIVVGAHRNAGGERRGVISVYTAWSWPPLAREGAGAPGERGAGPP